MHEKICFIFCSKFQVLEARMKTELLKDKSAEEIATIWKEYHLNKDSISAVIPAETFKKMMQRFQEFKTVTAECSYILV